MRRQFYLTLVLSIIIAGLATGIWAVYFFNRDRGIASSSAGFIPSAQPITSLREDIQPMNSAASSTNRDGCPVTSSEYTVTGNSMAGLIEPGQVITVLGGYYSCHPVSRNDVVAYKYSGRQNYIIKMAKGIPGDRWRLQPVSEGYRIIVNETVLLNAQKKPYIIPFDKVSMLQLYASSYPVIPADTYLLLGNEPSGTIDSTKFGLAGLTDIAGKVVY